MVQQSIDRILICYEDEAHAQIEGISHVGFRNISFPLNNVENGQPLPRIPFNLQGQTGAKQSLCIVYDTAPGYMGYTVQSVRFADGGDQLVITFVRDQELISNRGAGFGQIIVRRVFLIFKKYFPRK
jgi:hypothetical protein